VNDRPQDEDTALGVCLLVILFVLSVAWGYVWLAIPLGLVLVVCVLAVIPSRR
jgi:hypothetical protein